MSKAKPHGGGSIPQFPPLEYVPVPFTPTLYRVVYRWWIDEHHTGPELTFWTMESESPLPVPDVGESVTIPNVAGPVTLRVTKRSFLMTTIDANNVALVVLDCIP